MKMISPLEKKSFCLPSVGISYGFDPEAITPNIAFSEGYSENASESVLSYIKQQGGRVAFLSDPDGRRPPVDAFIDRIKFDDAQGRRQSIVTRDLYKDAFLSRLIPIASELNLLTDTWDPSYTWDPSCSDSRKELEELQNGYLIKNHGTSLGEFTSKAMSEVRNYKKYAKRRAYEAKADFRLGMDIVVGSLATLNRDFGLDKDDFFGELARYKIYPINSGKESNDILSFLQEQLV